MSLSTARPSRAPTEATTTSFLLANLHCPSCVSTIKSALQKACQPPARWISPNVITSVVTVEHDPAVLVATMAKALEDAGFEVCSVTSSTGGGGGEVEHHELVLPDSSASRGESSSNSYTIDGVFDSWRNVRHGRAGSPQKPNNKNHDVHLEHCDQCRSEAQQRGKQPAATLVPPPLPLSVLENESLSQHPSQATLRSTGVQPKPTAVQQKPSRALMSTKSLITVKSGSTTLAPTPGIWRASLAIGGMTCASCSNGITQELKKRDWITSVAVNLVSNSATVEFKDRDKATALVEAIEDLGYEAHIDTIVAADEETPNHQDRVIEIKVDGFYCAHCPERVANSLAGFRRNLDIVNKPTMERPIVKVRYIPEAPSFTVRHILAAIAASDSAFTASLYHAPTLEERSKQMHARRQRQILIRVIFTAIICIPTFVIGIVYMSLLPDDNEGKQLMTEPWTSGISRAQVALFILATPVYFFAADIFHTRAFKEVRVMWRRGSGVPILQRFYRFGSMNMLMSLGTSIAYISSLSQMIAAAVDRPAEVSDANFYFDSVVFLTFFLLLGRLIETYSKSKTGNAVEMLGKLKPTTAILARGAMMSKATATTTESSEKETDEVVKADLLEFGDIVRVPHGSSPPADGEIFKGETSFDESSLTGESRLIKKSTGDKVFAGTVNKDSPILVRITGMPGSSMLDQIVNIVREGQTKRAPMEQIADVLTTYFVPVVTLVAVLTWLIWMILGFTGLVPGHFLDVNSGGWVAFSLQFAIAVFVVACPCGLGLAAPTAIFVGGGIAAQHGILAKGGGEAFEKASRIDCVVFDKTGTMTVGGAPKVTDSKFFVDEEDGDRAGQEEVEKENVGRAARRKAEVRLLSAIRSVEENSSHPIAKAIVSFCTERAAAVSAPTAINTTVEEMQEIPGRGMRAVCTDDVSGDSMEILVGNEALMHDNQVAISTEVAALLNGWKNEAKSVAVVATRSLSSHSTGDAANPTSLATADITPVDKQVVDGNSSKSESSYHGKINNYDLAIALSISDPIRPEAAAVVKALQARGTRVWMLSGDNAATARAVAARVGIPESQVLAEVLPAQKAERVTYLQKTLKVRLPRRKQQSVAATTANGSQQLEEEYEELVGRRATVAMVGDGVNDAPALTAADVGIAVGSGSDVAVSTADFVLVSSELGAIVTLLDLSRTVFNRVRLNFGWALIYNMVAVPVAAGALYPVVTESGKHVRLDPVWASLAMALSSISVVLSSLALRSRIPGFGFRPRKVV